MELTDEKRKCIDCGYSYFVYSCEPHRGCFHPAQNGGKVEYGIDGQRPACEYFHKRQCGEMIGLCHESRKN